MRADLERAKSLLAEGKYTCVICRRDEICTDTQRGVKPLMDLLDHGVKLSGFCAADKVIGKATAFLYVLLGVCAVYTPVISTSAKEVLLSNGIEVEYDKEVEGIRNRTNTGYCPMETAVKDIRQAHIALKAIRKKLAELKNK